MSGLCLCAGLPSMHSAPDVKQQWWLIGPQTTGLHEDTLSLRPAAKSQVQGVSLPAPPPSPLTNPNRRRDSRRFWRTEVSDVLYSLILWDTRQSDL